MQLSVARLAWLLGVLALGCAQYATPVVTVERRPALAGRAPVQRIALAPFGVSRTLAQTAPDPTGVAPSEAAALVARYLAEALEARGVDTVVAEDVRQALGLEEPGPAVVPPRDLAQLAADRFAADAVLTGVVNRFRRRQGEAAGALRPASVSFEVVLHAAPDGRELWRATFDHTQKPMLEDVIGTRRYPGGGARWLTVEELARWGAEEVAAVLPAGR